MKPGRHTSFKRAIRRVYLAEFFEAVFAAVIVAVLLRIFVVSVYRIPTESMMPTLIPGDFIVAWKTSYGIRIPFSDVRWSVKSPARGDVVVFQFPDDEAMFVKRVVGVEGDRIEIRDGRLIVNEALTTRPQESRGDWDISIETTGASTHQVMRRRNQDDADFVAPLVVPPGHVFLMGDSRSDSFDSRHWGPVSVDLLFARAAFIGMSLKVQSTSDEVRQDSRGDARADREPSGLIRFERIFKRIE